MGEAIYRLIADFKTGRERDIAVKVLDLILKQTAEALDDLEEGDIKSIKSYPLFYNYIYKRIPKESTKSKMNFISDNLYTIDDYTLESRGTNKLFLSALVWHLADWTFLKELVFKLGALHCFWFSEEDMEADVLSRLFCFTHWDLCPKKLKRFDLDKVVKVALVDLI